MAYDERFAARVRRRLIDQPGFSERKMFGGLCFLLRGHMCCGVTGEDLMLRVHPDDYDATLGRPGARPMDFTGRPLRGMVYVAADALTSSRTLQRWIDQATAFAGSLPPKKTASSASRTRHRKGAAK